MKPKFGVAHPSEKHQVLEKSFLGKFFSRLFVNVRSSKRHAELLNFFKNELILKYLTFDNFAVARKLFVTKYL